MTEKQYPGGAGVTDTYIEGESAGLREEHGEAFNDEVATNTFITGTITFATAFGTRPHVHFTTNVDARACGTDEGQTIAHGDGGTEDEHPVTTSDADWVALNSGGTDTVDIWVSWLAIG